MRSSRIRPIRHAILLPLALLVAASPARAQRRAAPAAGSAAAAASGAETSPFAPLHYRYIGPVGNRVDAVAGVPGDPETYYAGAASGGVWKTTDGGITWTPVFDDEPVQSIGSLAVAPSDLSIVWAGTGEPFIRSHISIGWGMYRSLDAGKTWKRMGLEKTGRISRVVIDPTNPDIVFACALGTAYGPQQERGVYRTTDGGASWTRVLFSDENSGCSDLVMDPTNPHVLYAGTWQVQVHTWGRDSGGPGSGIFKSTDGGTTWRRLTGHGLPERPFGKVGLGVAQTDPGRVYALIETGDGVPWNAQPTDNGELWRSDDGGASWKVVSYDRQLGGRTAYYNRLAVSPDDEDEVYFMAASFSKTLDGGEHTVDIPRSQQPGGDHHNMWIDPGNGDRMIVADDQGLGITTNRGRSWMRVQLPIGQMYHVEVGGGTPYIVCGNRQDGPSQCGPSDSRSGGFRGPGRIPRGDWFSVGGGESGWATPDTVDPDIIWSTASGSGSRGGIVVRYSRKARQYQNVEVWPISTGGYPAKEVKYRFVWDAPFEISPHDHSRIYTGSQYLHVSTDGGRSWQIISPDLTRDDTTRMGLSGGLTPDNIGVEYAGVIYRIAESPVQAGLIWAGTNDGLLHLTRDAGKTWADVTKNIPDIPEWGTISSIAPSHFDAGTAFIAVDAHQQDDRGTYVYRTADFGKTWKKITAGIEPGPLGYVHVVLEDPVRRGLLFLGTENGLYVSFDDGDQWRPLQNDLPHAPVDGLTIQPHFHDLAVATYGRGLWILDDISPLEQLTPDARTAAVHLFVPRDAWRFRPVTSYMADNQDPTAGENPEYGAGLTYWLAASADRGASIAIVDDAGKVVRTLKGPAKAGLNRVWWNLRETPSSRAVMLNPPLYDDAMEIPEKGITAPGFGDVAILAPPARYTVRLAVAGQTLEQPLTVRKDPHSLGTEQEIARQTALLEKIRADLDHAARMYNALESARRQLARYATLAEGATRATDGDAGGPAAPADSLARQLEAAEGLLQDLRLSGRGQDGVRWPVRIGGQLDYLAGQVAESDFAPTTQQLAAFQELDGRLQEAANRYEAAKERVARFNQSAAAGPIVMQ